MLYTFKDVRNEWNNREDVSFDEYLSKNFIPIYDDYLNFLGYEAFNYNGVVA